MTVTTESEALFVFPELNCMSYFFHVVLPVMHQSCAANFDFTPCAQQVSVTDRIKLASRVYSIIGLVGQSLTLSEGLRRIEAAALFWENFSDLGLLSYDRRQ